MVFKFIGFGLRRDVACYVSTVIFCILFFITPLVHAESFTRVISLAPNITEMIYVLDAEDKLSGVTDACNYPASANNKTSTGPFGNPDVEKIAALEPDLVLYTEVKDPDFRQKLAMLGITAVQFKIEHFADLQRQMLKLGELLGRNGQAKAIVAVWEQRLRAAQVRSQNKKKIRVYFELWPKPRITAGKNSFLQEMIILAGGLNIAELLPGSYPKPTDEFILSMDPELIVAGYPVSGDLVFPEYWREVTAIKKDLVCKDIDLDLLLRPGPRLLDGLEQLQQRIENARKVLYEK
jgi:iron complex transport system substrate-binding protein